MLNRNEGVGGRTGESSLQQEKNSSIHKMYAEQV